MQPELAGTNKNKRYSLQEKIKKPYIILFTVVFILGAVLLYFTSSRIYWNKSRQLCEQLVSVNLDLLDNEIMDVQNRQVVIARNSSVRQAVGYYESRSQRDYPAELRYQREIAEVVDTLAQGKNVSAAYIVDRDGNIIYFYKESPKISYNMQQEKWFTTLTEEISMDTCYISGIHDREYLVNETDDKCISTVCPIQGDGYLFSADAYLVCDISLKSVFNETKKTGDVKFAVLDINNKLYTDESLSISEEETSRIIKASEEKESGVETLHQGIFSNSIAVFMRARTSGLKVIGVKNLDEITDMAQGLLAVLGTAVIMTLAAVAVLSRRIAQSVVTPVSVLVEECNRVASGERNVVFEEKESEEIAFLSDTIHDMVENVVSLSEKLVEEERKLSDERLRVLQHQINPHFLNNVLQMIKGMAVSGENEKISRVVTLLGHILAYSVYEPYENVALKTELEYLQNYVELQNIRYDNRIICSVDCEEKAALVQIPKLTLQPLVENAIDHGMWDRKTLIISVSAAVEADMICIIINDNGKGMEESEINELLRRMETGESCAQKSSVGIINVNERLQRIYGKEYGIRIHSKQSRGTTVIVDIPGKEKNESIVS